MSAQCEPWPLSQSCLPPGWSTEPVDWTPEQRNAVEVASALLRRFTAGVYGLCGLKIRPCRKPCAESHGLSSSPGVSSAWVQPMLYDGRLYNIACGCGSARSCGCGPISEIALEGDAFDIVQVKQDGVVVPNTAYRLDGRRMLVRTDGETWPQCQALDKPDTEVGTFSVLYRRGMLPDAAGRQAMTVLAVELAKACSGAKCALPARVTSVVREGITYDLVDDLTVFERGRTGIPRVDMWLAAVNPHAVRAPLSVYSPDLARSRETTWPVEPLPSTGVPDPTPPPLAYRHAQSVAATTWSIQHNLGFYPAGVRAEDGSGAGMAAQVSYVDIDSVRLTFTAPVTGTAYLS